MKCFGFIFTVILMINFNCFAQVELIKNGSFEHNKSTDGDTVTWLIADYWNYSGDLKGVTDTVSLGAAEGSWRSWTGNATSNFTQVTDHVIQQGNAFNLSFFVNSAEGTAGRFFTGQLFYVDGGSQIDISGWSLTVNTDNTAGASDWEFASTDFTALPDQPYIGKQLGIRFSGSNDYKGLDNVSLKLDSQNLLMVSPNDKAINIALEIQLQWTIINNLPCDVYFGTNPDITQNPKVIQSQIVQTYSPANLQQNITYYWRVDIIDPLDGPVPGPVWRFTTLDAQFDIKFQSNWPRNIIRHWAGPQYWFNTLNDWRLNNGSLECLSTEKVRTTHILSCYLNDENESFKIKTRMGLVSGTATSDSFGGFLIGVGDGMDYRAASIIHKAAGVAAGYLVGVDGSGRAVIRDMTVSGYPVRAQSATGPGSLPADILLDIAGVYDGLNYTISVDVIDLATNNSVSQVSLANVYPDRMKGNIALASHSGSGSAKFWFDDIILGNPKITLDTSREFGPIMAAFHTLSNDVLKLSAQLLPLSATDTQTATLEVQQNGSWTTIASETANALSSSVLFRIPSWNSNLDTPYRVRYDLKIANNQLQTYYYQGLIRKDPKDKEIITVAAFTGNHNMGTAFGSGIDSASYVNYPGTTWFPHQDLSDRVAKHNPDLFFFSGDTIYEGSSPINVQKSPESAAILDYLYLWYLSCWSFGDLTKDTPTVIVPDDHDVFQGNLWGQSGRYTNDQEQGGYMQTPDFVNVVHRTQSSHLPDPYDPTPVERGISVYYCNINYGRVSFAVIEDRKFKSGPEGKVPARGSLSDPFEADIPGLVLLGQRQLDFLEDWASDWQGIDMKSVLSQTIFTNLCTHSGPNLYKSAGSYDSNGWPQTPRNNAVKKIRKAFASHIAGDQHLASLSHYGVDDWGDGPWAICVPSIANIYPRAWNPDFLPVNHIAGMPSYTGDFFDLMGNKVTVWAVANPLGITGWEPSALHDRRPGYGIVKFNKTNQQITFECWPRYVDPADPTTGSQYDGWPKTVDMDENYGRKAAGYLPEVTSSFMDNPVLQVIKEDTSEIIYTKRLKTSNIKPKVFSSGLYTVNIGEPGTAQWQTFPHLEPSICGDWGYSSADLDKDCVVDLEDLIILIRQWLNCTKPNQSQCEQVK
ncbi:MAG: alkaline phosphatase D family protein [Phycisphaerae bacterium]|nr:alkaline phosphatase D family protein [Phycisphaerae bacterium]